MMQLNKVMKSLILALPVTLVVACSSHKNNNDQTTSSGINMSDGSNSDMKNSNLSSDEEARLQMQELQQKNTIYFGLDKYNIQSEFAQMLDEHANFLRSKLSYKITIEGHADERGTPEYNIALGERRATAVSMYLQAKGVSADQISIISYGKEKPAVLGHDEIDYAKNRRAVLVY